MRLMLPQREESETLYTYLDTNVAAEFVVIAAVAVERSLPLHAAATTRQVQYESPSENRHARFGHSQSLMQHERSFLQE